MRWQIGWQAVALAVVLFGIGLFAGSYRDSSVPVESTAGERLQPAAALSGKPATSGTIYVPVYSTLFLGLATRANTVELAAT